MQPFPMTSTANPGTMANIYEYIRGQFYWYIISSNILVISLVKYIILELYT